MHGLAVYLTDWSTDNFCVDERHIVTVVDLEHVVIVDQVSMLLKLNNLKT
jgi:hypothetical protein